MRGREMEMDIPDEVLSAFRQRVLEQRGDALIEIHGWLVGVMCAAERLRFAGERNTSLTPMIQRATDSLIEELRKSEGPL